MAIEYTKVGWAETPYKYANPTNMDKMDTGIKAAVDAVNALENVPSDLARNGYGSESGGRNIFTSKNYTRTVYSDGNTIINGTNSVTISSKYYAEFKFTVKTNTNYTLTVNSGDVPNQLSIFDKTGATSIATSTSRSVTFDSGDNSEVLILFYTAKGTMTTKTFSDIQLEEGTTATAYEPYYESNKMLTEDVAEMASLKYLGWTVPREMPIKNYVDSNGTFHQRVGRVDLGTLTWVYDSGNGQFYSSTLQDGANRTTNVYCSAYPVNSGTKYTRGVIGYRVYVIDPSYTDATAFRSAMSGVYLWYELSSAVEIGEGKEKSSHTIGTFGVTTINGAMAITSVTSGSLPPNNNTFFTIVSNGSTNSHNTSLHYDSNTLYIVSDKAQNVLVKWINFSA